MAGLKRRMVLVCALVLLAGPIQVVLAEANAVEIDVYETAICEQEIVLPGGSTEIVLMTGQATVHVFFEGPEEGIAYDDDGDTLDEVQTEIVELDLRGYSAMLGPVRMHLSASLQSMGEMEETADSNTGVLDVPPFGSGTVESFFDVFFEVEMLGQVFYGRTPMHLRGMLTQKPAGPLDVYENLVEIQLLDSNGQLTPYSWGANRFRPNPPNPPVEIDTLDDSMAELDLVLPDGGTIPLELQGSSTVHVFFEGLTEGSAYDDDANGLDEVRTELVQLNLTGFEPELGVVRLSLDTYAPSHGQMEERTNNTMGLLDVPPFASDGLIESFFDVYFKFEFGGRVTYGDEPMHLSGWFTRKPAGPGEAYEDLNLIYLLDSDGQPTGFGLDNTQYKPTVCGDLDHPYPVGDLNKDCEVNFFDIAILALHWLECTRPQCP